MSHFAVLNDSVVVNVIVADTLEIAEAVSNARCIEFTEENPAQIGWKYIDDAFVNPNESE